MQDIVIYGFVFLFLCFLMVGFFCISGMIHSTRLMNYLKKHNYAKWRELTTIGQAGPGLSNPFRIFPYYFSQEESEDEELLRLRDKARINARYFIVWCVAFGVVLFLMFLIALYFSLIKHGML